MAADWSKTERRKQFGFITWYIGRRTDVNRPWN